MYSQFITQARSLSKTCFTLLNSTIRSTFRLRNKKCQFTIISTFLNPKVSTFGNTIFNIDTSTQISPALKFEDGFPIVKNVKSAKLRRPIGIALMRSKFSADSVIKTLIRVKTEQHIKSSLSVLLIVTKNAISNLILKILIHN